MLYLTVSGMGATTPALASLAAAFPDASYTTITLINTLPSLTLIIGCLIMGAIAGSKIPFKTAGIFSLAVYLIFGILPAFWHNSIMAILIARALVGFGMGFIAPLGAACFLRMIRTTKPGQPTSAEGLPSSRLAVSSSRSQAVGCVRLTGLILSWPICFA
jgi:MFS family permease